MSEQVKSSSGRSVVKVVGKDARTFLQGLVTNDVDKLQNGLVYAAMLSPQGKYLFDFFLFLRDDEIHLDVADSAAESLVQRLSMYRLRADVDLKMTDLVVDRGIDDESMPSGAMPDPRHPCLGWRHYRSDDTTMTGGEGEGSRPADETALTAVPPASGIDWTAIRVTNCIPETGIELIHNSTYILEAGFERLQGVDFAKGCYVGQEVTARMRHKTTLRKGLAIVNVDGEVPVGTEIHASGRLVGTLYSQADGQGIAHLRFDRVSDEMSANGIKITSAGKLLVP